MRKIGLNTEFFLPILPARTFYLIVYKSEYFCIQSSVFRPTWEDNMEVKFWYFFKRVCLLIFLQAIVFRNNSTNTMCFLQLLSTRTFDYYLICHNFRTLICEENIKLAHGHFFISFLVSYCGFNHWFSICDRYFFKRACPLSFRRAWLGTSMRNISLNTEFFLPILPARTFYLIVYKSEYFCIQSKIVNPLVKKHKWIKQDGWYLKKSFASTMGWNKIWWQRR